MKWSISRVTFPKFRRFRQFIVMLVVLSLAVNMSLSNALASGRKGELSFDKSTPRNAKALKGFEHSAAVADLLEEAKSRGLTFELDAPIFVEVSGPSGETATAVAVVGTRGDRQGAILTGYFEPDTGHVSFAHTVHFKRTKDDHVQVETTIHNRGQKNSGIMTYNPHTQEFRKEDGTRFTPGHEEAGRSASLFAFGRAAKADHVTCQTRECNYVWGFFGVVTCTLLGLATIVGGIICSLVWIAVPEYVCNTIYYDC